MHTKPTLQLKLAINSANDCSGVIGEVIFEPVNELGHLTAVDILDDCRFRHSNINFDRQNGRGYAIDGKPTPQEQVDEYAARSGR
jgi:hypothetical protein